MPFESQEQAALFHAADEGESWATKMVPRETAHKFIADTHDQKISDLPKHVKRGQQNIHHDVEKEAKR